jgi:hypothetical protein
MSTSPTVRDSRLAEKHLDFMQITYEASVMCVTFVYDNEEVLEIVQVVETVA